MTQERAAQLRWNWDRETTDKQTEEWREDLTEEEAAVVESWDNQCADAYCKICEDILAAEDKRTTAEEGPDMTKSLYPFKDWEEAADQIFTNWSRDLDEDLRYFSTSDPRDVVENWETVVSDVASDFDDWNGDSVPYEDDMDKLDAVEAGVLSDLRCCFTRWLLFYAQRIDTETDYDIGEYITDFWKGDPPAEQFVRTFLQESVLDNRRLDKAAENMAACAAAWYGPDTDLLRPSLPLVFTGMSGAERYDFKKWLHDCCGADFYELTADQLRDAAHRFFDSQTGEEQV